MHSRSHNLVLIPSYLSPGTIPHTLTLGTILNQNEQAETPCLTTMDDTALMLHQTATTLPHTVLGTDLPKRTLLTTSISIEIVQGAFHELMVDDGSNYPPYTDGTRLNLHAHKMHLVLQNTPASSASYSTCCSSVTTCGMILHCVILTMP